MERVEIKFSGNAILQDESETEIWRVCDAYFYFKVTKLPDYDEKTF